MEVLQYYWITELTGCILLPLKVKLWIQKPCADNAVSWKEAVEKGLEITREPHFIWEQQLSGNSSATTLLGWYFKEQVFSSKTGKVMEHILQASSPFSKWINQSRAWLMMPISGTEWLNHFQESTNASMEGGTRLSQLWMCYDLLGARCLERWRDAKLHKM